jgi:hypothetical protein
MIIELKKLLRKCQRKKKLLIIKGKVKWTNPRGVAVRK